MGEPATSPVARPAAEKGAKPKISKPAKTGPTMFAYVMEALGTNTSTKGLSTTVS